MHENAADFESRKRDHIAIAVRSEVQSSAHSGFEKIHLCHEALPEIDLAQVSLQTHVLGQVVNSPHFISSMTAGHREGVDLNLRLAAAAEKMGWLMGVGSQRRQLWDESVRSEWMTLRSKHPEVLLLANIGLTQLKSAPLDDVIRLASDIEAVGLIVHTNPLQEAIQPEGTPHFSGGFDALSSLVRSTNIPVILKETGSGFSAKTLTRLQSIGLYAVDIAGSGGTNWGLVEGQRTSNKIVANSAQVFSSWGHSTLDSLLAYAEHPRDFRVWASGGLRSGLDTLKCLGLGAQMAGIAAPLLKSALISQENLEQTMTEFDFQLRLGLFLTGCETISEFKKEKPWVIQN